MPEWFLHPNTGIEVLHVCGLTLAITPADGGQYLWYVRNHGDHLASGTEDDVDQAKKFAIDTAIEELFNGLEFLGEEL